MKSFHDFVCLKEEDGGMLPPQNQMNPAANQMPPTGPSPEEQNPGQPQPERQPPPEAAAEMEGITNDIQRQIQRLFKVLDQHNLNKQKTATLLNTIIQQVAGGGKLTTTGAMQTTRNAMTTNSGGISPPMQPMANG